MNIKASNGCWLTQKEEVTITDRLFTKEVTVSSVAEAAKWLEVTDNEKKEMEAREAFFSVDKVDLNYLRKMDSVMVQVAGKVNDAHLTNDEALEMQKYYPKWDNLIGQQVYAGFRFECDGILFEVVEPHVIAEENRPTMQVMTLSLMEEEEPKQVLYKQVISSAEEAAQAEKNINEQSKI